MIDFSNAFVNLFQLASSSLLRLGQETDKELVKNRDSVYLLLDQVIYLYIFVFFPIYLCELIFTRCFCYSTCIFFLKSETLKIFL